MDKEYNIKNNKERVDKEFWIDTYGDLHKFKGDLSEEYSSFHGEIATLLYPESNRPTDILFDLGWVMVGSTVYSVPIIHKAPTQSQLNTLFDLGLYGRLHIEQNGFYIQYKPQ